MENNKIYIEYLWAYDWWLTWVYSEDEDKEYHRANDSLILESKQVGKYWPVYFKTEDWKYFKNLYEIKREEYDSIWESKRII